MKEKTSCSCTFCGTHISGPVSTERLEIHRWCKSPKRTARREKTSVKLPICDKCYKRLHPYRGDKLTFNPPIYFGAIAAVCVLYSFIQRDLFSIYSTLGIIVSILFCAGGAFVFTWLGYILTNTLLDDAFKPSVKVKPYSDLEVVRYIKDNGFVDAEDNNCTIISTDTADYVPFLTFRDTLKDKFGARR